MAFEQTKIIHGEEEADKALSAAKAMFGSHKVVSTEGLPFITLEKDRLEEGIGAIELFAMTDLCSPTNGDARRLISQGGASINDKKLDDIKIVIDSTWLDEEGFLLLKAGKKRYFKVIVE